MDVARASDQIDALIERRSGERDAANELAEMYADSARRHHARRREQNRWDWIRYFDLLAESHARTSQEFERRAVALLDDSEGAER